MFHSLAVLGVATQTRLARLGAVIRVPYAGGGFGGCTIAPVQADCVEAFRRKVHEGYERATGRKPKSYVCSAADGVGRAA